MKGKEKPFIKISVKIKWDSSRKDQGLKKIVIKHVYRVLREYSIFPVPVISQLGGRER